MGSLRGGTALRPAEPSDTFSADLCCRIACCLQVVSSIPPRRLWSKNERLHLHTDWCVAARHSWSAAEIQQVCTDSGSKRARSVSSPGAGSAAISCLSCTEGRTWKPLVFKLTFGFFCSATKETRRRSGGTTPSPPRRRNIPSTNSHLSLRLLYHIFLLISTLGKIAADYFSNDHGKRESTPFRRLVVGIDSVLRPSLFPATSSLSLQYIKYCFARRDRCKKNLDRKTAKHFKKKDFLCKTRRKVAARLTPAAAF